MVAEGLFDDEVTEDGIYKEMLSFDDSFLSKKTFHLMCFVVHLRIRLVDQLIPKSLYPSTSANTYWQIEAEASVLNGIILQN